GRDRPAKLADGIGCRRAAHVREARAGEERASGLVMHVVTPQICPAQVLCPIFQSGTVLTPHDSHLTPGGGMRMARSRPRKDRLEDLLTLARQYRGWSLRRLAEELGRD